MMGEDSGFHFGEDKHVGQSARGRPVLTAAPAYNHTCAEIVNQLTFVDQAVFPTATTPLEDR